MTRCIVSHSIAFLQSLSICRYTRRIQFIHINRRRRSTFTECKSVGSATEVPLHRIEGIDQVLGLLKGPIFIVGPPGCGKSTLLGQRFIHLVNAGIAKPEEILVFCSNEFGVSKLQEYVDTRLPMGSSSSIFTPHSFGNCFAREFADELGLPSTFHIMSHTEESAFLHRYIYDLPLKRYRPASDPARSVHKLSALFGALQSLGISGKDYIDFAQNLKNESLKDTTVPSSLIKRDVSVDIAAMRDFASSQSELAASYNAYLSLKAKAKRFSYPDQLLLSLKLLEGVPLARASIMSRFSHILVDDIQDFDKLSLRLLKKLCVKERRHSSNISSFVFAGDNDQAIFSFSGGLSEVEELADTAELSDGYSFGYVRTWFPDSKDIVRLKLSTSFRCSDALFGSAKRLVRLMPDQGCFSGAKNAVGHLNDSVYIRKLIGSDTVQNIVFSSAQQEIDGVADRILSICNTYQSDRMKAPTNNDYDNVPKSLSIGVFVRSNAEIGPMSNELRARGIITKSPGGYGRLTDSSEVKLLLSFLSAATNQEDSMSLYHVVTSPVFNFSQRIIASAMQASHRKRKALRFILNDLADGKIKDVDTDDILSCKNLVASLEKYEKAARRLTTSEFLLLFLKDAGILQPLLDPSSAIIDRQSKNIASLIKVIGRLEKSLASDKAVVMAPYLLFARDYGGQEDIFAMTISDDDDMDADDTAQSGTVHVAVMTAHRAKNFEFDIGYFMGMSDQRMPGQLRHSALSIPSGLLGAKTRTLVDHTIAERRLVYVAMTRIRHSFICTSAKTYSPKRVHTPSRFVRELIGTTDPTTGLALHSNVKSSMPNTSSTASSNFNHDIQFRPSYLSFSSIRTYIDCPKKYFFNYVMVLPITPAAPLSYGKSMHAAVAKVVEKKRDKFSPAVTKLKEDLLAIKVSEKSDSKTIGCNVNDKDAVSKVVDKFLSDGIDGSMPSIDILRDEIRSVFDHKDLNLPTINEKDISPLDRERIDQAVHNVIIDFLAKKQAGMLLTRETAEEELRSVWESDGFVSPEHEKECFEIGLRAIQEFVVKEAKSSDRPSIVEERFQFSIGGIKVLGVWDRVDHFVRPDGRRAARLIEYKSSLTASTPERSARLQPGQKDDYLLQLQIYSLAHLKKYGFLPETAIIETVDQRQTMLRVTPTVAEADRTLLLIQNTYDSIIQGRFTATPSHRSCLFCSFRNICNDKEPTVP